MSKYLLISKNIGIQYSKYKNNAIRLSTNVTPAFVDEVVVASKKNRINTRKITTFKDENGNIIERVFNYHNKPYRNLVYQYSDTVLGEENLVYIKNIKEYILPRNLMSTYRKHMSKLIANDLSTVLWSLKSIKTNYLAENINNGNKVLSQVKIENILTPYKEKHSFIEFPHIINGKKENKKSKFLSFFVNTNKNEVIKNSTFTQGVKIPKKDSYLRFRAIDAESMREPITTKFLEERNLKKVGIIINTDYTPKNEHENFLIAKYSDLTGYINFNCRYKFPSKSKLVSTAKHEVEHAWQYFLRTVFTGGNNERTNDVAKRFENFKIPQYAREAKRYIKSIDSYIPYNIDYEGYKKNYIEIMANKIGLKARNEYDKQGKDIRKAFPFIPDEVL